MQNWKQEYNGENKPIKWGINLVFKGEQLKYIGVNDTPKIWQYFIDELFED